MPPHCDSLDGPVVTAARDALAANDPDVVLPYVPETAENEVVGAFERTVAVRALSPEARELADRAFFETVVRIHRQGEGAPYTGLKPTGLDVGPVIPLAEQAVRTGDPGELATFLSDEVRREVELRLERVAELLEDAETDVAHAREHVEAMLGFQVWSHALHEAVHAQPHEHAHEHAHR